MAWRGCGPDREALRRELGLAPGLQLWICPARLETFKGLHTFLPLLRGVTGASCGWRGRGACVPPLQEAIDRDRLPVRLIGQKGEEEMVRLYAAADLFVLPSLSDPSPLSAVEACAARLPLLASVRIGNFPDVLEEGVNGWAYDPETPERYRGLVQEIAGRTPAELQAMGEAPARCSRAGSTAPAASSAWGSSCATPTARCDLAEAEGAPGPPRRAVYSRLCEGALAVEAARVPGRGPGRLGDPGAGGGVGQPDDDAAHRPDRHPDRADGGLRGVSARQAHPAALRPGLSVQRLQRSVLRGRLRGHGLVGPVAHRLLSRARTPRPPCLP